MMRMFFVVLGFLLVLAANGFCGEYGGGDGTADNPYQIFTVEHLVEFGKTQDDYTSHFILMADLDMAGTVYKQAIISPDLDKKTWGPQTGVSFNGVFDGGGHTISNFTAENRSVDYLSIFGYVKKQTVIKNLHVKDANVNGGNIVSCLVASLEGRIENCSVTGNLSGRYIVGGMVGFLDSDSALIVNSSSNVTISPDERSPKFRLIGGLVASSQLGSIDNCFSKCEIVADRSLKMCGGIIGSNRGTITNSYCEGVSIVSETSAKSVGAFCGSNGGSIRNCLAFDFKILCNGSAISGFAGHNNSLIAMCLAEGQVAGKSGTGGIAGDNAGYIIDCYSNVTTAAIEKVGGFAGKNSYGILRSYSIGKAISISDKAGGFVGENTGLVDLSFWDAEKSGNDFDVAAVAKGTSDLKKKATFKYWGGGVWVVDEDSDYPRLTWENTPGVVIKDDPVEYGGGSGTVADPYLIYDAKQLTLIGVYLQDLEKNFKLMSDIDMQGVEFYGIGYGFGFGGVFDGNGHVIRNYSIDNGMPYTGFFDVILKRGIVRNVVVEGFEVTGVDTVGGLCGKNEGLIEKCKVSGKVYAAEDRKESTGWGGLVGYNRGHIVKSLSNVHVEISCDKVDYVGGFVGLNGGVINNCGSVGPVVCSGKTNQRIGGFVGLAGYGTVIDDCYSFSSVTVSGAGCGSVGGFAGGHSFRSQIGRSYCSAPVNIATDCKGYSGFIGYCREGFTPGHCRFANCFCNSDPESPNNGQTREHSLNISISAATSEQLKDAAFLESAGWDVSSVPNEKAWFLESGEFPRSNSISWDK